MRRVVIYGSSGSGKSTLASELAERMGVPHVEIDAHAVDLQHSQVSHDLLWERFRLAVSASGWVAEGMHRDQLGEALSVADTFVWVDVSRRVVALGLLRRNLWLVVTRRRRHGRRVTVGGLLRDELPFILKAIRKHPQRRAYGLEFFNSASAMGARTVRLRTRRDMRLFLQSLGA